ncbi:MAG: hypothetical protein A4E37_01400 [Methanoregulaceae archaeon PtaB.Bin056]|nr:MAG: hypothetical protein A4E37_01400 [Methanoregulaceae archaeon PtaB.Bin056]
MLVAPREDAVVDAILFDVHPGKPDHRLDADTVVGAGDVDERPLACRLTANIPLEHDLRVGDQHAVTALVDPDLAPQQFSGKRQLFSLRDTGAAGKGHRRVDPDNHGHWKLLSTGKRLPVERISVPSFDEPGRHPVTVKDEHPVD